MRSAAALIVPAAAFVIRRLDRRLAHPRLEKSDADVTVVLIHDDFIERSHLKALATAVADRI